MSFVPKIFRSFDQPDELVHPEKTAFIFAGVYAVAAGLYIWLSSSLAGKFAGTISNLSHIEFVKGTLFVVVTGILLFLLLRNLLEKINSSQTRLKRQRRELQQTERRAVSGMLASSIGHDINNILTVSNSCVYKLGKIQNLSDEQLSLIQTLQQTNEDLSKLAQRLMSVTREDVSGSFEEVNLNTLIRQAVNYTRVNGEINNADIQVKSSEQVVIEGQDDLIHQMAFNLLLNAFQSSNGNPKIRIDLSENGDSAIVEFHDNGPGIPDHIRGRVFEPFYTTKSSGTGLGLLSVQACIEIHHGEVDISRSDLGGACFRITLPKSQS